MTAMRFDNSNERNLLDCLGHTVSLVSDGASPDDALAKAAEEFGLHPDSVPLAVQAYNVGRQTHQREKCANQGTSCLVGEYPIAHLENVQQKLYPEGSDILSSRKTAAYRGVSTEYSLPPVPLKADAEARMTKLAAAKLEIAEVKSNPATQFEAMRLCRLKSASIKQSANLDIALLQSYDELTNRLDAVRAYFRKNASQLAEVEFNSRQLFGCDVSHVFDYAACGTKMARANDASIRTSRAVDQTQAPYSLIKAALDKAAEYVEDVATVRAAQKKIASEVAKYFPFAQAKSEGPSDILQMNPRASSEPKQAGFLGNLAVGAGGGLGATMRGTGEPKPPTSELVSGMTDELADPSHLAELKAIHARAMLGDLMANDEVISGYDPDEVTDAYNEIMQASPNLSTQAAVVRPMLRKRLTGGVLEAFDVEQLTKMDQALRSSQRPQEQWGGAPPSQMPKSA